MDDKTTKTAITIEKELLEAGKARARSQRRSLSAHFQFLLERDLESVGLLKSESGAGAQTQEVGV